MIEFDPVYCDRIARRFEKLTGKEAHLAASGQTFEATQAERHRELEMIPMKGVA